MVFGAFFAAERSRIVALLAMGVAVGSLEGGFIYLTKAVLSGNSWDWRILISLAFGLVSLRCLLPSAFMT